MTSFRYLCFDGDMSISDFCDSMDEIKEAGWEYYIEIPYETAPQPKFPLCLGTFQLPKDPSQYT